MNLADIDTTALGRTLASACDHLLAGRSVSKDGCWVGELSASALSTAVATFALHCHDPQGQAATIRNGLTWLACHANTDGGWGDTVNSPSNISTTILVWSALAIAPAGEYAGVISKAENWLRSQCGSTKPADIAAAVNNCYGQDRTFSAPILTMCALAGRLGTDGSQWQYVANLPFELAVWPHRLWKSLRMNVVSYALPALIAIGQVKFHHRKPACPVTRIARLASRAWTLRILERIQPASGGYLEAIPLTGFVLMSLAKIGQAGSTIARRTAWFLSQTIRPDGSWPIDANLSTWVTTLAVNSLKACGQLDETLPPVEQNAIRDWLLAQQHLAKHEYTQASPGGWAWTNLSGAVPDADDTAGAMLALKQLAGLAPRTIHSATMGADWLINLQNSDGGIPTFCKGWGRLPFDRSSPDLTAHAIRAWSAWQGHLPALLGRKVKIATRKAVEFLSNSQRRDGAFLPLWFGNQHAPDQANPLYGTTRVILALAVLRNQGDQRATDMLSSSLAWLLAAANRDGGFGGAPETPSSIEETAWAIEALTAVAGLNSAMCDKVESALAKGVAWLIANTREGVEFEPSPVGLYFAKLWYFERLYPVVFTVSALGRARQLIHAAGQSAKPANADTQPASDIIKPI
jgi:squalene-hopene/tetraprenyl-beta-curcumene cyclase